VDLLWKSLWNGEDGVLGWGCWFLVDGFGDEVAVILYLNR
jgi:hypothetical protein